MKYKAHTESGAIYILDPELLTWERNHPTGLAVIGYDQTSGKLVNEPFVMLNRRMLLEIYMENGETTEIRTTRVTHAELLP